MKKIFFFAIILSILALNCGRTGSRLTTAGQIISNSWEGEDDLDIKNTWKPLRQPVIVTKADSGDVIALFVGEFKAKYIFIKNEDEGLQYWGVPIELRITVNIAGNTIIASPTSSVIITTIAYEQNYETRSFLAFVRNLAPGTYTVMAEWRSRDTGAHVRNRTLTVWETIKADSLSP
jgi:hypothetical protein